MPDPLTPQTAAPAGPVHRPSRAAVFGLRALAIIGFAAYLVCLWALWGLIEARIPDEWTLNALGHSATVHEIHRKVRDDSILLLVMVPLVLCIEAVVVGWQKSAVRRILFDRNDSVRMDIAVMAVGVTPVMRIIGVLMTFGLSAAAGTWIHDKLSLMAGFNIGLGNWPEYAQIFVYFWAATFFDYWTHRIDHTYFFWPLHRYHHSTRDFCAIASLRAHPGEFTGIFVINIPMAILGAPVSVMVTINLLVVIIGLLIHSGIDSNWGWFGRWVIQSPNHHRLHHILDYKKDGVGHFSIAPIWDHLFGTWKGEADQTLEIGVDMPYRMGWLFFIDMFRDYYHFWKGFALALVGKRHVM